ncbi:MAG: glycosyltransferase involved in cell wall biosynthesis [Patiriisocius sp.]|jgi:glycosyltransferase involved in cell wall biosynthesis
MKYSNPLVSVIMPAFNADKYISSAIESIIQQSYNNWELIVVDDGSTDKTNEIVRTYMTKDERIKLYVNNINRGLIFTRNRGLENANGKYIANLDSDDISLTSRLEEQVRFLEGNPDYVLLGSGSNLINSLGKKIGVIDRNIPNEHLKTLLLFSNYFINSSVLMRIDKLWNLKYSNNYPLSEDFNLFIELSNKGEIGNLNKSLINYRIHDHNISIERQDELSKVNRLILQKQLLRLDVRPSSSELMIHSSLVNGENVKTESELNDIEAWLFKLIEANQEKKLYDEKLFNYYCAFFYRRACEWTKGGIASIVNYRKSTLRKHLKGDFKGNSVFFVKSIFNQIRI